MKVTTERADIERHGVVERITCGMQPTAHSFKMLARQYSNPVKAILQELGANAMDSHIRAGIENTPFRVELPTRFDPHLRIRDFGVSMSPHTMKTVYAEYMKSDKQHTNNETGYFGIGSKTPLAYGDSFNITTYLDGILRMYTLCYNEDGFPELNVYGEHETDEPNGVEVSFAVKDNDYNKFKENAEHVYSFFSTAPIVNGSDTFALKKYDHVLEGDDWYMTGGYEESYVVMGNIAYPIDSYQLPYGKARSLLRNGVHFTVPMGDVHMVPSREHLEYNDTTIETIRLRCEEIADAMTTLVVAELDACESAWQASILARKWDKKFTSTDLDYSGSKWNIIKCVELTGNDYKCKFKYFAKGNSGGKISRSTRMGWSFDVSTRTKIVIQDQDRGFDKASRAFAGGSFDNVVFLITGLTKAEALKMIGAVEADKVVFLSSELPVPPRAERGPRVRKTTRTVKEFCPRGDSPTRTNVYSSRYWNSESEVELSDDHVYVKMDRYEADFDVQSSIDACKAMGLDVPPIVGLNNATRNLALKKNFVHFRDWIRAELEDLDNDDVKERAAKLYALGQVSLGKQFRKITINASEFTEKDSPAKALVDFIESLKGTKTDDFTAQFVLLAQRVSYNFEYDKDSSNFEELESAAEERYPIVIAFLNKLHDWQISDHSPMLVSTINSLDLLHSLEN